MNRLSQDEYLLNIAKTVATRATCSRLQVGAVLSRSGQILSTGRNGAPAGLSHCNHTDDSPCTVSVHAEVNAVALAARHGATVESAELHCTHAPCVACAGVLINAGICRIVYDTPYRSYAGIHLLTSAGAVCEHISACRN